MSTLKRKLSIFTIAAIMAVLCAVISFSAPAAVYAEDNTIKYNDVATIEQLRELPPDLIASWAKYDSRKYNIVTSVKDQGYREICWSYASLAAMETSILRKGLYDADKDTLDLDEVELAKAILGKWDDPLNIADDGLYNGKSDKQVNNWNQQGSVSWVANFCMRWQGIFDETVSTANPANAYSKYKLQNVASCDNVVDDIKYLIAAYGGVAFSYQSEDYKTYFIAEPGYDHASFIVGWDDSIAASAFGTTSKGETATQNGGWIVKNSYGSGDFDGGYQYISYDSTLYEITAFEIMDNEDYDWCYQYSKCEAQRMDVLNVDSEQYVYAASYAAKKGYTPTLPSGLKEGQDEYLKGVTVGVFGRKAEVNVTIYTGMTSVSPSTLTSGTKAATVSFTTPDTKMGNYDIELDELVKLEFGKFFTICVEIKNGQILRRKTDLNSNVFIGKRNESNPEEISWSTLSMNEPFYQSNLTIMGLTVVREEDSRQSIADYDISLDQEVFTFNGNIHKPVVTVTDDEGNTLDPEDYTVKYSNHYNVGTANVEVVGKGDYKGKLFATYTIEPLLFVKGDPDLSVRLNEAYYNGRAQSPEAVIVWNGFILKLGKDFTVRYSNNIAVGEDALARITFQGRFTGTIEQTFVIHKGYLANTPKDVTTENGDISVLSEITPMEDWMWVEPETKLKVGANRVKIRHIDYTNYENGEMEIVVTRLKFQKLNDLYAYDLNSLNGTDTDFESLKAIKAILASFTDDDREALGKTDTTKVQTYQSRLDAWDKLVNGLDEVIALVNK